MTDKSGIGFIYNVFDGAELLESSIKSIRNVVDEVVVVFQKQSYFGNVIKDYNIEDVIDYLQKEGLIDKAILHDFDNKANTVRESKNMERKKYNVGLDYLKNERKIEYFRPCAIDEFFIEDELKQAIAHTKENKISRAFCRIKTYSDTNLIDKNMTDVMCAALLYKNAGEDWSFGKVPWKRSSPRKIKIDPVISYGNCNRWGWKEHIFPAEKICMHHHRLTRLKLSDKMANSTIRNRKRLRMQIEKIESIRNKANPCENIFNIDIDKFKNQFINK